ncbi:putative secreted protein [Wickerhamomyces ciferrii]|uniref:Secreted protein n=1 Tax=Wickerhamomyces ciferrii (strain ATCC 14091 / BCRC 22168 / CBS 111 / JCM 3599 / NBRC 0793 / NRRL Y-1031 F-60-10) TaxID=1206466 RepID=K0KWM9_WICCF|nr:uncharacterized protein BN7_6026 [Wickerhamomyces ciferrii]CCH46432.1 putative secreted protein [Wickerhamomyces ciferrii]
MKNSLLFFLILKLALGAITWEMVLSNQTDLYQYFNLVRCLAANEPTSNSTIGLDHDNILSIDTTTQDPDHASFVFGYCWKNYGRILLHHTNNNSENYIIQPIHITETLDGHEMFKYCRRGGRVSARDTTFSGYGL